MTRRLFLGSAAVLLIVCVAGVLLVRTPGGTSFADLPSDAPLHIRSYSVDSKWPWGAGVYGAMGGDLYWFFRMDPENLGRGFGTERYDHAATNVWNFAVMREGSVEVIGRFESAFSGALLMSELRAGDDGAFYVAITGSGGDGEVVRLGRDGTTKRIWTGPLGDWPDVHVVGGELVVDADYDYLRLTRDGAVRERSAAGSGIYHATSCVFEGALWMNIDRRLRRIDERRPLDLVPGLLPEKHYICAETSGGIAVIAAREKRFLAARAARAGDHEGPLVRLDDRWWDLSSQGPVVAAWVRGDANTLLVGNENGFRQLRLPDALRGFRIPHGTTGDELFLVTVDGYRRVQLR